MRKKHIVTIIVLALALCIAASGCGKTEQKNPSSSLENSAFENSGEESKPNGANGTAVNGSKLSLQDQQFIEEYGYLTHHTEVTADNLSWQFDEATGVLSISGSGPMKDYIYDSPAWEIYKESVKKIVVGDGITTVGDYAFYDYMQLISVQLPDTVEYIGVGAFANAYQLEDIPFPAALKEIASIAFLEAKVHKPLTIPNGVEIIANGAFHANDFWDTITIPASVYYIEEEAFSNSLHLHDFVVDPANEHYTSIDGVLYDKDVTLLLAYPMLKETTDFSIPDTVTRIAGYAFDINFFTKTLHIPKSVKEVGGDQFGLLRQIEKYTVDEESELFKTDSGALLSKDGKTFYAYPVLGEAEEYTLPDGVEKVEFRAFAECWTLKKLYLPEGIQAVGIQAFEGMNGTAIYLPESFTDTASEVDSTFLFSVADGSGWDLESGFTYLPNTYDGVEAKGEKNPAAMTVYYAGSEEKWNNFAAEHDLWLGDTKVICKK